MLILGLFFLIKYHKLFYILNKKYIFVFEIVYLTYFSIFIFVKRVDDGGIKVIYCLVVRIWFILKSIKKSAVSWLNYILY